MNREELIKDLADKFCRWPLPPSVSADLCATKANHPHRTGTNLLTHSEAAQMIDYLLDADELEEMTLLEAAKAVVHAWGQERDAERFESIFRDFRAAIAAEEAKPASWLPTLQRTREAAAEMERDKLRAKLAAMESAEPVAMAEREPWFCHGRSEEVFTEVHDKCGTSIMRRKAWLPAYTPMTDEILWGIYLEEFMRQHTTKIDALRAIERAVLARLGVGS